MKFNILFIILYFSLRSFICFAQQAGSLDSTFGNGGIVSFPMGPYGYFNALAIQADGKIVAAGIGILPPGTLSEIIVARFNSDGSLDSSFGGIGFVITNCCVGCADQTADILIQPDGKILLAGYSSSLGDNDIVLLRYDSTGTLDFSFGNGGIVRTNVLPNDISRSIKLLASGEILLSATISELFGNEGDFGLFRYQTNGLPNLAFGSGGNVITAIYDTIPFQNDLCNSIVFQPDGKIIQSGLTSYGLNHSNLAMVRFHSNGVIDNTFGVNGRVEHGVTSYSESGPSIFLQSDGSLITTGAYNSTGNFKSVAYKFDSSGVIDTNFGNNGLLILDISAPHTTLLPSIQQADSMIIVCGEILLPSRHIKMARFNTNGIIDSSFGNNGYLITSIANNEFPREVILQSDGKILVGGGSEVAGNTGGLIARIWHTQATEIHEINVEDITFSLSPNPAINYSIATINADNPKQITVQVIDISGRIVLKPIYQMLQKGKNDILINLASLTSGIYFIKTENQIRQLIKL